MSSPIKFRVGDHVSMVNIATKTLVEEIKGVIVVVNYDFDGSEYAILDTGDNDKTLAFFSELRMVESA